MFFAFLVPEMGTLFRAARIVVFKSARRCAPKDFLVVLVFETMHMVGMAMLVFVVFPELDVIKVRYLLNLLLLLLSMPLCGAGVMVFCNIFCFCIFSQIFLFFPQNHRAL